jgi:hypothetical protein
MGIVCHPRNEMCIRASARVRGAVTVRASAYSARVHVCSARARLCQARQCARDDRMEPLR